MLAFIITVVIFLFLVVNIMTGVSSLVDEIRHVIGMTDVMSAGLQVFLLSLISLVCFCGSAYMLDQHRNY